jgi:hypothetical protein
MIKWLAFLFRRVEILRLRPGDAIVLSFKERLSSTEVDKIHQKVQRTFPGHALILLDNGAFLRAVRRSQVDELLGEYDSAPPPPPPDRHLENR